jgi:hypothetical protein
VSAQEPNNLGGTHFADDPGSPIRSAPLDSFGLTDLDFIKIDVEGMADRVIAGGAETISNSRPAIYVEMIGDERQRATPLLEKLGYRQTREFPQWNYLFERA